MTTYRDATTAAGRALHLARIERDSLPPRAAAQAAHEPSGPSVAAIEAQIIAHRSRTQVIAA